MGITWPRKKKPKRGFYLIKVPKGAPRHVGHNRNLVKRNEKLSLDGVPVASWAVLSHRADEMCFATKANHKWTARAAGQHKCPTGFGVKITWDIVVPGHPQEVEATMFVIDEIMWNDDLAGVKITIDLKWMTRGNRG